MALGALTTTFTPPSSCIASFSTDFKLPGGFDVMGPVSTDGCFPPNYNFRTDSYFSPGICPVGYSAACVTPMPGFGSVQDTVTVVTCCPTSYTCNPSPPVLEGSTYVCNSHVVYFVGQWVSISGHEIVSSTFTTVLAGEDSIVNAFGIQIQMQSTNFISFPVSVLTPTSSSMASSMPSSTYQPIHSTDNGISNDGDSGGLSAGAAAGVGIGVGLGVLLLAGAIVFTYCMGRRRAKVESFARRRVDDFELSEMNKRAAIPTTVNLISELPEREPGELDGRFYQR
ncbi:hypothetical protein F4677DRAFT_465973 [Hypoxylon crocopeplum]|nr:hypothetical protein F4677DRAFT_465973 [Hypoxylon crocopeplum]